MWSKFFNITLCKKTEINSLYVKILLKMGKIIYCASNGSPIEFPNNTLTQFGNKLPFWYDFQQLDNMNFHVGLKAIGFSVDFERHFQPIRPENPSIIISEIYTDRVSVAPPSKCLSLNKNLTRSCNINILDNAVKHLNVQNDRRFIYIYLDSEDLTYTKLLKFLLSLQDHTYMRTEFIPDKNIVNFKTNDTYGYLYVNVKLLEHMKIKLRYQADLISASYMKQKINIATDVDNILNNSTNINGDNYFPFRCLPKLTYAEINLSNMLKPKYPKIVKVRCDNIRDQIFNEKHAKDLAIFCPEITKNQNFFWHEFETTTFSVLENTLLNDVSFKLVDENNEQLLLKTGIPTVLKLDIQAMSKNKKSFNVRVTSDKQNLHPHNTRSSFNINLPQTLFLNENWKVALSSINLPNVFNTFPMEDLVLGFLYLDNGVSKKIEHFIPQKNYTQDEIVDEFNFFLQRNKDNVYIGKAYEEIPSNGSEKVLVIEMRKKGSLIVPRDVAHLIGYTEENFRGNKTYFTYPVDPEGSQKTVTKKFYMNKPIMIDYFKPSYIMLYTKCVAPTAVSGQYMNILKIFPVDFSEKKYVIQEFKHREYLNLSNFDINELDFQLRSHTGELISFDNNNQDPVILNLHFTNYDQ